jgi:hypothetical protein
MYQSDRGSYRNEQNFTNMLLHSCLGQLLILAGVLLVLGLIAFLTNPSEQTMRTEMVDNIRQVIEAPDSTHHDWLDDFVNNMGYAFTDAGPTVNKEMLNSFNKYNRMEYEDYGIYSTMVLYNNFQVTGTTCGVGIFGMVIPTVTFDELLLHVQPIHQNDYDEPVLSDSTENENGIFPDYIFEDIDTEFEP